MITEGSGLKTLLLALARHIAQLASREPVVIVSEKRMFRLERLAELQAAERRGDTAYLQAELGRMQFSREEIDALGFKAANLEDWPENQDCMTPSHVKEQGGSDSRI